MPDAKTPHERRRARRRWRAFAVLVGVASAELGLALLLGQVKGRAPEVLGTPPRPLEVVLYDPPPPISLEPPAPETGGGAPAAPSRIHTPPPPKQVRPVELPAPPRPAPEPAPVVGVAPSSSPEPGFGQGGAGTGSGSGVGSGSGPGSGATGPRLITSPTLAQIRANHPRQARSRYGRVELSCRIRLDSRLEACRVVSEDPSGVGFGAGGLAVSSYFRFQPATENGRPVEGQPVTVGIDFGIPPRR
ncbi:energy transducer TonB [Brevundimonas mediterranea]|uniref:Protein TonB n=1 Tax=Brevundimonas mediterranea TaxID=74329 RepID=A0A7W6A131_9CAUL|nr:energy transducer TonB [Brevundimonas mediterranea]MBB3870694.1 protein TonB [Brevundimonas mediterranea]